MQLLTNIQDVIHKLEVGLGPKILRVVLLVLVVVGLAFVYDLRSYRNFATQEAMDQAQLARNLSEGRGYTTSFIRPFSLCLIQRHNQSKQAAVASGGSTDLALIQTNHPDLANPPVYPVVLAGLMKVLPFHFQVETQKSFWSENGSFQRYQPEFLIAMFNQILLVAIGVAIFFIARKLFDDTAAWISTLLVFGCDRLWQFSVSGLSTLLVMLIFLGIFWVLLKVEETLREPQPGRNKLLALALVAGVLTGLGTLTRYSFGGLIIPVATFFVLFGGQRRVFMAAVSLAAFGVVLLPWLLRNESVSGTPFGTAGYTVSINGFFQGTYLERALNPDLAYAYNLKFCAHKLFSNLRNLLQDDLPRLGGSWGAVMFFAGLLLGFRNQAARHLRYFLMGSLVVLTVFQALGETQQSEASPTINPENLIVLVVPLMFIFGTVCFLTFLDQMKLPFPELRYIIMGGFVFVCSTTLIGSLFQSRPSPVVYPPYFPPDFQKVEAWTKPDELIMSDIPWAVAWYGDRQCVWLTLDAKQDFYAINDYLKSIEGLYLSRETLDGKLVTDCAASGPNSWGRMVLNIVAQKPLDSTFPLRRAPSSSIMSSGLFLTDRPRWSDTLKPPPAAAGP